MLLGNKLTIWVWLMVEVTAIVVAAGRVYPLSDTRAAFESETILIVVVVGEKTWETIEYLRNKFYNRTNITWIKSINKKPMILKN